MDRDAANCEVNRLVTFYQALSSEDLASYAEAGAIDSELESGGERIAVTSRIRQTSENSFSIWVTASGTNWWRDERIDASVTADFEQ